MFEVGFSELLVIAALALVVLGPEKLPKVVGEIGRWMGRARAMARQFREQLEAEAAEVQRKAEAPVTPESLATPPADITTPSVDTTTASADTHTPPTHPPADTPPSTKPDDERRA